MNKSKLNQIKELLALDNVGLGKSLGYTISLNQCRQVENLLSGKSKITPLLVIALECLARREDKLEAFNDIVNNTKEKS